MCVCVCVQCVSVCETDKDNFRPVSLLWACCVHTALKCHHAQNEKINFIWLKHCDVSSLNTVSTTNGTLMGPADRLSPEGWVGLPDADRRAAKRSGALMWAADIWHKHTEPTDRIGNPGGGLHHQTSVAVFVLIFLFLRWKCANFSSVSKKGTKKAIV